MRKLIVVALLLVAAPVVAKELTPGPMPINENGEYEYTGTFEVEGVTAVELFSRARAWVARAYVSAQDVIQLNDKDARRIIVKGTTTTTIMLTETMTVRHVLTIQTKDGRYRYSLTGLETEHGGEISPRRGFPGRKGVLKRTHAQLVPILNSLQLAMEIQTDDDW